MKLPKVGPERRLQRMNLHINNASASNGRQTWPISPCKNTASSKFAQEFSCWLVAPPSLQRTVKSKAEHRRWEVTRCSFCILVANHWNWAFCRVGGLDGTIDLGNSNIWIILHKVIFKDFIFNWYSERQFPDHFTGTVPFPSSLPLSSNMNESWVFGEDQHPSRKTTCDKFMPIKKLEICDARVWNFRGEPSPWVDCPLHIWFTQHVLKWSQWLKWHASEKTQILANYYGLPKIQDCPMFASSMKRTVQIAQGPSWDLFKTADTSRLFTFRSIELGY
jgi:hypothetical protein